ncbi:MAG: hypothetical protein H6Q49_905, partial [Deltaproteobacteria bacterium]|nr:hypothetical protein [Deltaproteobacteria bacterium]
MKSKNIQLIFFSGIFFLFASQARAENWIYYDTALAGTMYYDKSSIFEAKKGILSVWTKNILSTDSKKQYFSILKNIEKAPDDPSKLYYYKSLMEIDCANKKFRYVYVVFYDEQDGIIHASEENETSAWNKIEPNSVGEKLMNLVSSESVISKGKNIAEQVEESVPPKETAVAAKVAEPVPPKETVIAAKAAEPVPPKETAPVAKVTEPIAPKEKVVTEKAVEPVPLKETVLTAKVDEPAPPKESAVAANVVKPVYPKETIAAVKVEKPVSAR